MSLFLHSINLLMQIMALIGARGCSKGLKNKNLLILGKKSLIEHTIHDAINSKKFDRIIVSTDDDTIARVSKKAGAEVPFLRPKKFSKDTTIMKEVVSHALSFLKKQESYFGRTKCMTPVIFDTDKCIPGDLIDVEIKSFNKKNLFGTYKKNKEKAA